MNDAQFKLNYGSLLVAILYSSCILFAVSVAQSCGPKVSPRLLREIPCDMAVSSYCTQPGSAYPWSSVRRYIFENQGSMKRMYGEQRQSQIIQEEIYRLNDKYGTIDIGPGRSAKQESLDNSLDEQQHSDDRDADNHKPEMATAANISNSANPDSSVVNSTMTHLENITSKHAVAPAESDNLNEIYTSTIAENLNGIEMYWSYNQTSKEVDEDNQTTPSSEQDIDAVDADEVKEVPVKGYNACPITQEVVAPYWANNTRGETLALLNVYPFEQYIHWEKCSFEEEQMFCRDGCRCEQQYRLHRLLAFDPKNECRGIFADWFRFPGCCVCICYDNQERINTRKARL